MDKLHAAFLEKEMRKLAVAASAFSVSVFISAYILPVAFAYYAAAAFAIFAAGLMFVHSRTARVTASVLLSAAVGFGWFGVHYGFTARAAERLSDNVYIAELRMTDYPQVYTDSVRYACAVRIGGEREINALLYDYSGFITQAEPGDIFSARVRVKSADTRYGEEDPYYNSRDIYLTGSIRARAEYLGKDKLTFRYIPMKLNRIISECIDGVFAPEIAGFMKALMCGNRENLYDDSAVISDFSRSGFMHVVCVSGMHIAFLIGFIQLVFGKSRRSAVIGISLIWVFVLMTGAGAAALRAGVMQTMLVSAPLFSRENDAPTSLAAALAFVLMLNPFAAAGISLQLSFAAMAGILFLAEPINSFLLDFFGRKKSKGIVRGIVSVISSSLAVMAFTAPISAIYFGYIPLLSPVTNLLALWMVSLCFCGGYIACLIAVFAHAAGAAAGWAVGFGVKYLFAVCRFIAASPYSVLSTENNIAVWWIILVYILIAVSVVSKANRWIRLGCPVMLSVLSFAFMMFSVRYSYRSCMGTMTVLDVGQGQCIAAFSGRKAVMIDCGSSNNNIDAGITACNYLQRCGCTHLDELVLTHLHADHVNGVMELLRYIDVDVITVPTETEATESEYYAIVAEAAEKYNTRIRYLTEDTVSAAGAIELTMFAPENGGDDKNESCIIVRLTIGDYDMLITADSPAETEEALTEKYTLNDIETIIAGHHGSKYSSSEEYLSAMGAQNAVISVGYNTYGHPSSEVLERLTENGYTVYRTDLNGNIEIRIG